MIEAAEEILGLAEESLKRLYHRTRETALMKYIFAVDDVREKIVQIIESLEQEEGQL